MDTGQRQDKGRGVLALITAIDHDAIRYEGVQISVESVSALSGDKVLSAVPRDQICRITLCHDTSARYPFLQFSFGFIFILLGIVAMTAAFLIDTENNVALWSEQQFVIPLVPIAIWVVIGAGFWLMAGIFRTEYHLLLDTKDKALKLFFKKSADIHEIHQFIRRARLEFGYVIDAAIIEESPASS